MLKQIRDHCLPPVAGPLDAFFFPVASVESSL